MRVLLKSQLNQISGGVTILQELNSFSPFKIGILISDHSILQINNLAFNGEGYLINAQTGEVFYDGCCFAIDNKVYTTAPWDNGTLYQIGICR